MKNFRDLNLDVINFSVSLPSYVFTERFNKYLFFDADIGSSKPLILVVQEVIRLFCVEDSVINVYAYSNRGFLGSFSCESDWLMEVKKCNQKMHDSGDYGGLILIDSLSRWVVVQENPIEMGVFAINYKDEFNELSEMVEDNFFDVCLVAKWISNRSESETDIVDNFGNDFLVELIKNYSVRSDIPSTTR